MVASTKTDVALGTVAIPHEGPEEYNNIWQKVRAMWSYVYDNYYEKVRTEMVQLYFLTTSFPFHLPCYLHSMTIFILVEMTYTLLLRT